MMHLLMTRPDLGPDGDDLESALKDAGHGVVRAPVLAITHTRLFPTFDGLQGIVATSSNGLRAVAPFPEAALRLPLYAVGPATAAVGRALGFQRVYEGAGDGHALAALIRAEVDPSAGPLLHLSGDKLALDLAAALKPDGFDVHRAIVYRAEAAVELPEEAVGALREGRLDGVVLMSPRTARVYAGLVSAAGVAAEAGRLVHFCLSEAVARETTPLAPANVKVAAAPNSQEMLALIARGASDSA